MKYFKNALLLSLVLVVLCGLIYPLGMTGLSQLLFNHKANGSIITVNGKEVGSEFIGQNFTDDKFFHGRISAVNYNTYKEDDTKPDKDGKTAYAGVGSGSQNLAPSNEALTQRVQKDIDEFLKSNPNVKKEDIPTDLLTGSGSGLDPHVSPKAAEIQIPRISKSTGIKAADLNKIVAKCTDGKVLGIFGEKRVNVLKANVEISNLINK